MITYELAKRLKDAGFRKDHLLDDKTASYCEREYCPFAEAYTQIEPHDGFTEMCYPTLPELIEACGEGRFLLEKGFETAPSGLDVTEHWVAQRGMFKEQGSTPEEAVANLWLAINNHL